MGKKASAKATIKTIRRKTQRKYSAEEKIHNDVQSVSLSMDGKLALSGSDDGNIILWDLDLGEILRKFKIGAQVRAVSFSSDSTTLKFGAGSYDRTIRIWRLSY